MFDVLKILVLLVTGLLAHYSLKFLKYKNSEISTLYGLNLLIAAWWGFCVCVTLLVSDYQIRVFFTQIRQITIPFLTTNWPMLFILIFHHDFYHRWKKYLMLLYIVPAVTSLTTILSLLGFPPAEGMVSYGFERFNPDIGLISYKVGPVLQVQFFFGAILLVILLGVFVYNSFSAEKWKRNVSRLFLLTGFFQVSFEIVAMLVVQDMAFRQISLVNYIPMIICLAIAIKKHQFLGIKDFVDREALDKIPLPVVMVNPRDEIWDYNLAAEEILKQDGDSANVLNKILLAPERFHLQNRIYKKNTQDIQSSKVISLTDVTEFEAMNQELLDNILLLRQLNEEVLEMNSFSRNLKSILAHDLMTLLRTQKMILDSSNPDLKILVEANDAASRLLLDVLSWTDRDESLEMRLEEVLHTVRETYGSLARSRDVDVKINVTHETPVYLPKRKIEVITRNLLSNALKASLPGTLVEISASLKDSVLVIEVKDEGNGYGHYEAHEGLGIGMKLANACIQEFNGTLSYKGREGGGTIACVSIPLP